MTPPHFLNPPKNTHTCSFSKPREFDGRFVWDYWHVPNQYTLLRTPADGFFPQPLYESLERQLLQYGMQHLGCRALTPVWLSYYVEGCRQELHTDSPHGPWAFVLSLTQWDSRRFSGGETQLLRSNVLDYWGAYEGYGQERGALVGGLGGGGCGWGGCRAS